MSAPIIAIFNQSGGVGKTTVTQNLGYNLGQLKKKVLVVDVDPQSSLTAFMGLEPMDLEKTIYQAVVHKEEPSIVKNLHGIDLLPSNLQLSKAEMELAGAIMRDLRLKQVLEKLINNYDIVLLDCPPSLGILSVMSLVASTHVIVPIQTEFKALKGTELLINTIMEVINEANLNLSIAGIIPTMHDARLSQASKSLEAIQQLEQIAKILPIIPRATDFANASQNRQPLAVYNPKHPAVKVLEKIATTIMKDVL
ncbi:MAG: ParA family protein [Rhizonema sp. NSF051]|nr:ParA family protein [Rhizonema sp. NSF051]